MHKKKVKNICTSSVNLLVLKMHLFSATQLWLVKIEKTRKKYSAVRKRYPQSEHQRAFYIEMHCVGGGCNETIANVAGKKPAKSTCTN